MVCDLIAGESGNRLDSSCTDKMLMVCHEMASDILKILFLIIGISILHG